MTFNNVRDRGMIDLSIMYSLKCDLTCPHCMYSSSPNQVERLSFDKLKLFLYSIDWSRINSIGFYGGEPTLFLDQYSTITSMIPLHIDKWVITNGAWSRDMYKSRLVMDWMIRHSIKKVYVSGTRYHLPHQDRGVLANISAISGMVELGDEKDSYIPMGRLGGKEFSCTHKCDIDSRPTRLAILPSGDVMFQNCDGRYPILANISFGFNEIVDRGMKYDSFCPYYESMQEIKI